MTDFDSADKNQKKAIHIIVYGIVQGVGFRAWTASRARALGITGIVRNNPDYSVEILAEGSSASIDKFIESVKTGNSWSRIDRVSITETQPSGFSRFEIEE